MERGPRLNIDVLAGLLFIALGTGFLVLAMQLPPGPPRRLGPGSFPTLVASLTIAVGVIVAAGGLLRRNAGGLVIAWRKLAIIVAALGVFATMLRGAGLIMSTLALVVIASRAHPELSWRKSILLGAGLGLAASLLFTVLLKLPVPALGPWFSSGSRFFFGG